MTTKLQGKIGGVDVELDRYKCEGGVGCKTPGCEFVATGKPEDISEKMYMCPFNRWRGCRWRLVPADPAKATGEKETKYTDMVSRLRYPGIQDAVKAIWFKLSAILDNEKSYIPEAVFDARHDYDVLTPLAVTIGLLPPPKPVPQAAPTGTCKQCGKPVKLGKDGCCNNGHELCFACWEKAGHNCPVCEARYSKAAPIEGIEKGTP